MRSAVSAVTDRRPRSISWIRRGGTPIASAKRDPLIARWRREVERFATERLDEFDAGIRHALEHPAALPRPEAG